MATSLRDNLTSSYFNAAHKLYPKKARRRIIAYVESYDDIAFWRTLLEEFEDDEHYFQVMLPSATSLAKGKKMVLMNTLNTAELGRSLIACVDSDYDFLLQGATNTSRKINRSRYIFQTYTYAIENYHCFAESLHEVCVQATLNDRSILDFNFYLKKYSEIVYPLFLWNVWFYRQRDTYTFPMYDFHTYTSLREINLRHPEKSLESLQQRVNQKLAELKKKFPHNINQVNGLQAEFKELGLVPETTYLYMQGHHVMDNVVMKLLIPVCTVLRREREQEIKRLAEHNEQFRNELTCYQNSQVNVEIMLKKNVAYKRLFHYDWLRQDISEYLEEGKNRYLFKESNPSTKLKINNLAVFREDKLQGYLTEKESIAAGFLNNTITNTIITFKCDENKYISTEIMNPKTDFEFEKDKLKVKIKVSAEGNINEVDCDLKISEPKVISDIERMTQEQIKQSIIETINKVNKEYKSDTFGFLDKIYKSNPKYSYKTVSSRTASSL